MDCRKNRNVEFVSSIDSPHTFEAAGCCLQFESLELWKFCKRGSAAHCSTDPLQTDFLAAQSKGGGQKDAGLFLNHQSIIQISDRLAIREHICLIDARYPLP